MSFLPQLLMVAGTVAVASSAVQEGKAMSAAELANAEIASLQAGQVRQAGTYEEKKLVRSKKQALSTQRALYAKSGVLISEGSPISVMADTATQYEMDIQANRYNTAVESAKYDYEAEYRKSMAKRYKKLGYTKAIGSTLLSAGTIAGSFGGGGGGTTGRPAGVSGPLQKSGAF